MAASPRRQLWEAHIAADLGNQPVPSAGSAAQARGGGLVVKAPLRGAFVAEVSARDVAEIASIRVRVEPDAGDLSLETLGGPERPRSMRTLRDFARATKDNN
jgi:hypothetical protein